MRKFFVLLFVSILLPFTSFADDVYKAVNSDWILKEAPVVFPMCIGKFIRGNLIRYNKEETNISIGYNIAQKDITICATIYVYPAPKVKRYGPFSSKALYSKILSKQVDEVKKCILYNYKNAKFLSKSTLKKPFKDTKLEGQSAFFEYDCRFAKRFQRVGSELYLFIINEKWFLKYRISYPIDQKEKANKFIQQLLQNKLIVTKLKNKSRKS